MLCEAPSTHGGCTWHPLKRRSTLTSSCSTPGHWILTRRMAWPFTCTPVPRSPGITQQTSTVSRLFSVAGARRRLPSHHGPCFPSSRYALKAANPYSAEPPYPGCGSQSLDPDLVAGAETPVGFACPSWFSCLLWLARKRGWGGAGGLGASIEAHKLSHCWRRSPHIALGPPLEPHSLGEPKALQCNSVYPSKTASRNQIDCCPEPFAPARSGLLRAAERSCPSRPSRRQAPGRPHAQPLDIYTA